MEKFKSQKREIVAIVGPTSSGKTELAIKLCKKYDREIISADSRQIYEYMDIGTNKTPQNRDYKKYHGFWEIDNIRVWGYDLITPDKEYSAFKYVRYVNSILPNINLKKKIFIVGGSGFYLDCLIGKIRLERAGKSGGLRKDLNKKTTNELLQILKDLRFDQPANFDINNRVRLIRAIEKLQSPILNKEGKATKKSTDFITGNITTKSIIGLTAPREYLYDRADAWVDYIWGDNFYSELQGLISRGYDNYPAFQGLIYKQGLNYYKGLNSLEETLSLSKFAVHAYIRRQQTWFKRNKDIIWFDLSNGSKLSSNMIKIENLLK